jgi:hypothetical protein
VATRWTADEDRELRRRHEDGHRVRAIAVALGRSPDAVTARARHLGIAPRRGRPWSAREDALVRSAASRGVPATVLAAYLDRSSDAVRRRRILLVGRAPARPRYRPGEDQAIRRCFADGTDIHGLARRLGRSADAVRLRARVLGVHEPSPRRRWTPVEDAAVRDGYAEGRSCATIADAMPGRSTAAVAARAAKLGLGDYARSWTALDDVRLGRFVAEGRLLSDISQALVRTPEAVRRRCRRLGLPPPPTAPARRARHRWTFHEDEVLRLHAGLSPAVLAELLGRTDNAVTLRLRSLGLRATREGSPHHKPPAIRGMTPGQRAAIERADAGRTPTRALRTASRLGVPVTAIYAPRGPSFGKGSIAG